MTFDQVGCDPALPEFDLMWQVWDPPGGRPHARAAECAAGGGWGAL